MKLYDNKNHLQFDSIKIRTKLDYFIKPIAKFNEQFNPKNGNQTGLIYNSKNDRSKPFDLFVGISYPRKSLSIGFSSKILLDDYPKLITRDTFKNCLENICKMGVCELDIPAIIKDCFFSEIHATKDVDMILDGDILNPLNSLVNNYRRFRWEHYEKGGITFTKDVESKDCKESITIYNKEKEINSSKNKDFLFLLNSPNKVAGYFKGKTRFEAQFKSIGKIKDFFNISDTHIDNVFGSDSNPILEQFNRVFGVREPKKTAKSKSLHEWFLKRIILYHNHDLKKIEQDIRQSECSRSTHFRMMKQVEALVFEMKNSTTDGGKILERIRGVLQ